MASLNGNKIKDSYQGLLKTVDNNTATGVLKEITDGQGNALGVHLGTAGDMLLEGGLEVQGVVDSAGGNKIAFHFANQAAFPDATTYHGAIAHSHADGKMYFAHSGAWHELANSADIPTVFDGDYNSLTNTPTIPTVFSGDYGDLTNTPTIPTVFSGDYTDLTNQPTIPTPRTDSEITGVVFDTEAITASGASNIDFSAGVNFHINASGAYSLTTSNVSGAIGQAGNIIIKNTAATTAAALPSEMKTPNGDTVIHTNTSGAVNIISYYIYDATTILVNYIGNFS